MGESLSREDYLDRVTLAERVPLMGPVALFEYDEGWPGLFEREAARLAAALGKAALQIEHVGSTSVPGLCAKPIIDILLAVADSGDEAAYLPQMEAAGYTLRIREPEWFGHRMFKGPDTDVNLHVFSDGCPEIQRMLVFRHRLRTDEADRELYAQAKRRLAAQTWRHVQDYADAKTAVVADILARALAADGGKSGEREA